MSEEFIKCYSTFEAPNYKKIPQHYIEHSLLCSLFDYISDNFDKIPMKKLESSDAKLDNTVYRLELNIISDEEYKRLKDIEKEYKKYKFNY